ncbi:HAD family hydrolase [Actinocrispum wychmicini]|uniref:HAD family hydrolase n=1 Tax=Actinocrispum wychmicini TaxID=1213861 RepID=UPI001047C525|nr:HAD family hydrolase [Actinocrispum wychmicini]
MNKVLIFDADDTLWENNVRFERVIDDYLDWLKHPTLDKTELRHILDDIEHANVPVLGYGSKALLQSLAQMFERLYERPVGERERTDIAEIARALENHEVDLVPQVSETLAELGSRHDLLLLTKGDPAEQRGKLDASNLGHHFRSVHIVAEKNVAAYRSLVDEHSLDVAVTWMIGNSPHSDILPARAVGMNAVFIPNQHTWVLEQGELDPADKGVLHLAAFTELLAHF